MKKHDVLPKILAVFLSCAMVPLTLGGVAWGEDTSGSAATNANANADDASTPETQAIADPSIFASGSGTEADPFVIANDTQLTAFRDSTIKGVTYKGQFITLSSDIDLQKTPWQPIGGGVRKGSGVTGTSLTFQGTFDGANHTVKGLLVNSDFAANYALGFFGAVCGGTVKNLNLEDVEISQAASQIAGGAVGMLTAGGTVENVTVSGSVSALCGAGGIVGRMTLDGTISHCTNTATVTTTGGSGNTGGIVGAAYYTSTDGKMVIEDCINEGAITGTNDVGGIAGLSCAFISGCENKGAIHGSSYALGGIAGEVKNYGGITESTNDADITFTGNGTTSYGAGGIVGWVRYPGAAPDYAASALVPVTNNTNHGAVSGSNDAGGIIGTLYNAGTVTGNENTAAALSATNFAGGIVGNVQANESVPESVQQDITIKNNISTTPEDEIKATYTGQFAYNNIADKADISDNGTAWNATNGADRYVSVPDAVAEAQDGDTVTLEQDVTDQPVITKAQEGTVTVDLNDHALSFAPQSEFVVEDGTLVITGDGSVVTSADPSNPSADLPPVVVKSDAGEEAAAELEGGSYNADVSQFTGTGYSELVKHQSEPSGKYVVLMTQDAKDQAEAQVEKDGRTVYYENADDARQAAADDPAATVTVYDEGNDNTNNSNTDDSDNGANENTNNDNSNENADNANANKNENSNANENENPDEGRSNTNGNSNTDDENENGNANANEPSAGDANANDNAGNSNANQSKETPSLNGGGNGNTPMNANAANSTLPQTSDTTPVLPAVAVGILVAGAVAIVALRKGYQSKSATL